MHVWELNSAINAKHRNSLKVLFLSKLFFKLRQVLCIKKKEMCVKVAYSHEFVHLYTSYEKNILIEVIYGGIDDTCCKMCFLKDISCFRCIMQ